MLLAGIGGLGRFADIGSATAKKPVNKLPHTGRERDTYSTVALLKSVADGYARFG